jgi:purine-binding chemotaxis protein CheW
MMFNAKLSNKVQEVVVFAVEELICAIPVLQIQEIIKSRPPTKVHNAPAFVAGVINLRGQIVTVVNLRKIFGNADYDSVTNRIIIVPFKQELIGLLVDEVDDSITVETQNIMPPPGNIKGVQGALFESVIHTENGLIAILSVQKVVQYEDKS